MTASVLVIDDDVATVEEIQRALAQDGYQVALAQPGVDALRKMLLHEPDLVILGVSGKETDWQFCRRLLTFLEQPLLLLLGTKNRMDRVQGLELGADDCMIKPILDIELVARTRALLRRSMSPISRQKRSLFVDGELVVDLTRKEIRVNDDPIALTPTEFRLLTCFTNNVGEVVSHDRICTYVWGTDCSGSRDMLKPHIHNLRKKLEPDPSHPQRILTRRGEGYLFRRLSAE